MTTALPFHAGAMSSINSYGYYSDYGGGSDYWTSNSPYPNSVSSHGESPDPYVSPAPHTHGPSSAPRSYFGSSTLSSTTSYAVDSHSYAGSGGYPGSEPRLETEPSADARRLGPKRRVTANRKERRRTASINNAFSDLRDCIPNVPPDTKLSKIKTLRLATSYIAYLMELLDSENANLDALTTLPGHGFKAELGKRTRTPEQEERRKRELVSATKKRSNEKSLRTIYLQLASRSLNCFRQFGIIFLNGLNMPFRMRLQLIAI